MKLTKELIMAGMLKGGGFYSSQRELLGSKLNEMNWTDMAVGREVTQETYDKFMDIKRQDDLSRKP